MFLRIAFLYARVGNVLWLGLFFLLVIFVIPRHFTYDWVQEGMSWFVTNASKIYCGIPYRKCSGPRALSAHKMFCDRSRRVFYGFRSASDMFVSPTKRIPCLIYRLREHSQAALARLAEVKKLSRFVTNTKKQ